MLKVKFKKTGEIRLVTNNVAHGLIESGEAVIYKHRMMHVESRQVRPSARKVYKTK